LCLPEEFDSALLRSLNTALGLRARFPKEYEAWEKSKNEIERRFLWISAQRKAEMHVEIEEDPEDIQPKIRREVVSELLKTFP
jgi:hypothetical protein